MDYSCSSISKNEETNGEVDPIFDIIDFLVRCAKISFKSTSINQPEIRTNQKIEAAYKLYRQSPTIFLLQFGKYLSPNHLDYFEKLKINNKNFETCIAELKLYHSTENRIKRVRNRRFKALHKLQQQTDYFTEKQMMYRNPLLYEQLIGQYLTDEEIRERDAVDNENLTLLNLILDTVDRNHMREMKNNQMLKENEETYSKSLKNLDSAAQSGHHCVDKKQWGEFDFPDTKPLFMQETRNQAMINANERNLLREEFLQEMYSSFIEGRDTDFDYDTVDNNEEYDDLQQMSQDAEDKYFDSEDNNMETLEDHMQFGRKTSSISDNSDSDSLDLFMKHINKKISTNIITT